MKISVIIPTSNRFELLINALESLNLQTFKDFDVIIVDDASNEAVKEALDITKYPYTIKIIRNETTLGGAISRNLGIDYSDSDFVCFLDDDDVYLPNKLESLMGVFHYNDKVNVAFGKTIHSDSNVSKTSKLLPILLKLKLLSVIPYMHTNSTLIKRGFAREIKFCERLGKYQDTQFHAELIIKGNVRFLNSNVCIWNKVHSLPKVSDLTTPKDTKRKYINSNYLIEHLFGVLKLGGVNKFYLKLLHAKVCNDLKLATQVDFLKNDFVFKLLLLLLKWIKI